MELILFIILLAILYYGFKFLFKLGKNLFSILFIILLFLAFGGQILIAYIVERIGKLFKIRYFISWLISIVTLIATAYWGIEGTHKFYESFTFSSLKFVLVGILFIVISFQFRYFKNMKNKIFSPEIIDKKENNFYIMTFTAFALVGTSAYIYLIFEYLNIKFDYLDYLEIFFFISSTLLQLYILLSVSEIKKIFSRLDKETADLEAIIYSELYNIVSEEISLIEKNDIELLVRSYLGKLLWDNKYVEINTIDDSMIIRIDLYNEVYEELINDLESKDMITDFQLLTTVKQHLPFFDDTNANFYIDSYLSEIGQYNLDNNAQKYFSLFKKDNYRTCSSCGVIEYIDTDITEEWFCSDLCRDTEKNCLEIKEKPFNKFVEESATSGFVLMQGAIAHNQNHKITTPNNEGTAHGFAAEKANHYSDKISGKKAKIIGDDNAKNGADRLVNGQEIQTKYYKTAQKSVNAAFDKSGNLKYIDSNGKPMQIEVPKDQYDKAVETMANKIKDGKVPGVTDPNEAKNLIRKGSITYQQAKNITEFGTFESLTFDVIDGAVVSFSAAGISFGITVVIHYLNTKDKNQAIQTASLQAGKTFITTMVVYVGAQQLQRLNAVANVLQHIDVKYLPKSLENVLKNGMGISSRSGLNKMLKGSIVTSAVLIAVSSGPDFLKMLRGRMSGAQFLHNTAIISSGVAGGGIGTIVGGVLGTPLGPIGVVGGQFLGGMAGGMISSFVANKFLGKMRESDQEKMMKIIQIQFEYLAKLFMMRQEEIDNISLNLSKYLTQNVLETMYSQKIENRIAFANFILKPIFVGVVKQREIVSITNNDIIKALEFKSA
ncbi:hypothetical protein [Aliarcobacter butzleri]|uniref:hypothetical protein n=1 Tax=Aliarcobacter butzleri TaxID=28197 RepID=UPI00263E6DDE|nr:hypothetical protein [Aliarcobacter butzleri]MDN5048589.1 hypothetical protein [Aliarcobacter butzleri]MDN5056691.1 hypothetical protein [Aliarcobacter butzleri]